MKVGVEKDVSDEIFTSPLNLRLSNTESKLAIKLGLDSATKSQLFLIEINAFSYTYNYL
jgi:hypothetical protein